MARAKQVEVEEEEELEEIEEIASKRGPQPPRISITLNEGVRRKVRLAAALNDMEVNEWCRVVLVTAARRTVEKLYPDKV
jgi:16S rRNA U516 pseudouridylate synthase RsuA-like enzyme